MDFDLSETILHSLVVFLAIVAPSQFRHVIVPVYYDIDSVPVSQWGCGRDHRPGMTMHLRILA